MKLIPKKILVVGLFVSDKNRKKVNRSAADQLAELLANNNYPVITVSDKVNRAARFFDTAFTILNKSYEYDIAIVPLYGTFFSYWWAYTACLLLKLIRKKVVLVIHGGSIPARMKKNAGRFLRVLRKANVTICPSPFMITTLNEHGVEGLLIENVINLKEYQFHLKDKFRPRILWMRTLHEIYNPEMAVRVTAILRNKYPNIKMVIAGREDGSLRMVTQLAEDLDVDDAIVFPGYISNSEKNTHAADLDVYICTNRIDNAPVSLIEMMALGLPVVSVNVGGIPYLVTDKVNGLLVNLDDDEAMAACISSIIEQPSIGKELVKNGLNYSKQFGEEPVMKKWKQLFAELGYSNN